MLLKLQHQILGKVNIEMITQSMTSINALTYDSLAGRIIVSDNNTKNIYAVSEDGKTIKQLVDDDIGYVEGMDFGTFLSIFSCLPLRAKALKASIGLQAI